MPNTLITVTEIARRALPRLIENLVFPNLVYKDYSEEYVAGKGAKVQVKKPPVFTAAEFNASTGVSAQAVTESSVEVALDKIATVDIEFSAIEAATSVDSIERLFIEPAMVALAQKINSDGLSLYADVPYTVGAAGATPDGLDDFANAEKMLNNNEAPVSPRYAVWNPDADAAFKQLTAIVNAEKSGSTDALRNGSIGRVFGLENFMSQAIKRHTKGTLATAGTANKSILLKGAATAATSVTLDTDDSALTGTLKKGDILTFTSGTTVKTAVVTADATADTNEIDISIYPALTIADNAVVTILANHTANLAFNPSAFAFVTRPLAAPAGVESYVTSYNGITLRVVRGYDMQYKKEMLSMDILYGYKTMYPEMAVRVLG